MLGANKQLAGRDAILLKPAPLPVLRRSDAQSFFGGLPLMPAGTAWPLKNVGSRVRPLTFVAQIALDELPSITDSPLPATGTLCFFLDFTKEWLEEDDVAAIYFEQPLTSCVEHRSPWRSDDAAATPWFWLERDELGAYVPPKFPLEFLRFRSYADYDGHLAPPMRALPLRGLEVPRWTFESERDDWPFAWGVVEHTARAILTCIELAEESGDDLSDQAADVRAAAEAWRERSRSGATLDTPEADVRREFRVWCDTWRPIIAPLVPLQARTQARGADALLAEAVRLVASLCSDERGNLDLVPQRLRQSAEQAWNAPRFEQIAANGAGASLGMNQMLGFGEAVQDTPIERADDVLLLQIAADQYSSWWPESSPDGVIQIWIEPQDLADRRFDRIAASFDCS